GAVCVPVVGANHNTVARDLRSVSNDTDAPRTVTRDLGARDANATPATAPRTKTGLDGKTYTVQPVKVSFDTFTAPSVRAGPFVSWKRSEAGASPLDAHGLHYSQLLRVGSSQIVSAPTRAARAGATSDPESEDRLGTYTGGTLADEQRRP